MSIPKTSEKRRTGYEDFIDIFRKFKALSVVGLAASGSVPFAAYYANTAPPPDPEGATIAAGLVELIALIVVFQLLRSAPRRLINKMMLITAPLLIVVGALYLTLYTFSTYERPGYAIPHIQGFICRKDIPKATAAGCPFVNKYRLERANYVADEIWEPWTVKATTVILHLLWLGFFAALSTLVGSFLVYQTKVKVASRTRCAPSR